MHKSSIYLPDELKRELGELSTRAGRSEADLIRQAIERLLSVAAAPATAPATPAVRRPRPAVIGVGVGPGDPGLVTDRARATLADADRVIVLSTDVRSVGRAEMVVRSVAPTARVQRLPFAIGGDPEARIASLHSVADEIVAAIDAAELVAVAVIGDPTQWTVFPDLAELIAARRPAVHVTAEPGITSYQAAAAAAGSVLGAPGAAMVVVGDTGDLAQRLDHVTDAVVLYKASTDAETLKNAAASSGRGDAIVAELSGLPGQRLMPLTQAADGPISYLAAVVFPARHTAVVGGRR